MDKQDIYRKAKIATPARMAWYTLHKNKAKNIENKLYASYYRDILNKTHDRVVMYRAIKCAKENYRMVSRLFEDGNTTAAHMTHAVEMLNDARKLYRAYKRKDVIVGNLNISAIRLAIEDVDCSGGELRFTTDDIILRDSSGNDEGEYHVGQFNAWIVMRDPRLSNEWVYRATRAPDNTGCFLSNRSHPHLNGCDFCFGQENHATAAVLIEHGMLSVLVELYRRALASYNSETSYFLASRYSASGTDAGRYVCDGCGERMHQIYAECGACDKAYCESCYMNEAISCCPACGDYVCENCGSHYIDDCAECRQEIHSCNDEYMHLNGHAYHLDCLELCGCCQSYIPRSDAHKCDMCNDTCCDECTYTCAACDATLCDRHTSSCLNCGATLCSECRQRCGTCGKIYFCEECVEKCTDCGRMYCPSCASKTHEGYCYECGDKLDAHVAPDVSGQSTLFEKDEA